MTCVCVHAWVCEQKPTSLATNRHRVGQQDVSSSQCLWSAFPRALVNVQPHEASLYKMPATLDDAHVVNVLGFISSTEVRLAILVEFIVRFTPTENPRDDLLDKPQWLFEAPLLTFRDEGYATDPVDGLRWSLKAIRPPFVENRSSRNGSFF